MQRQTQIKASWPPVTKSVIGLSLLFFVIWFTSVLSAKLGTFFDLNMSMSLDAIKEHRYWVLLTYGFFHKGFIEVLFASFAVWLFGTELQTIIGMKKWWAIQILSIVLGAFAVLAWDALIGLSFPVHGYHAAIIGLISAYCWKKWDETMYLFTFPLKGKMMLLVCVGFSIIMSLFDRSYVRLGLDAAGIFSGIIISGNFLHYREAKTRFRLWNARRKLKLVRGPDKKDYGPN